MTNKLTPLVLLGLVLLVLAAAAITPAAALDAPGHPRFVKRQSGAAACVQCLIGPRQCTPACPSGQVCAFLPKTCTECAKSACVPKDKIPDGWSLFPSTATATSDGATSSSTQGTDATTTTTTTAASPTTAGSTTATTTTGATSSDATPASTAQGQANATKGTTATAAGAVAPDVHATGVVAAMVAAVAVAAGGLA